MPSAATLRQPPLHRTAARPLAIIIAPPPCALQKVTALLKEAKGPAFEVLP